MSLIIDNKKPLTLKLLRSIRENHLSINIAKNTRKAIDKNHQELIAILKDGKKVYGINTGFGKLANKVISAKNIARLQKNLVMSHACGVGPFLFPETVRLIYILKLQCLSHAKSGVSMELMQYLMQFYNKKYYPCIPIKGSVGASGDVAPLAHFSLPLIGMGYVRMGHELINAKQALEHMHLEPYVLKPKEGLALINGAQVSNALALNDFFILENYFAAALIAASLSCIASGANIQAFDKNIHQLRNHKGQILIAKSIFSYLKNSEFKTSDRVQDPYSLRCTPQVLGACWQQIFNAAKILINEANAVSDNPLIINRNNILHGGNFHAEPIAFAADNLALAITEIGNISERRIALLLDKHVSNLPEFLVSNAGLNSGFMTSQVTAAALASENKVFAHPASSDSIPTSGNQEDHVSMATFAARRLHSMNGNLSGIIAIELLTACQAIDLAKPKKLAPKLQKAYELIREQVDFLQQDRYLATDINAIKELLRKNCFTKFIDKNILPSMRNNNDE